MNNNISQMVVVLLKVFLKDLKKQVVKGNFTLADRDKNMEFIRDNGLMVPDDIKEILLALSPKDYVGGPEDDRNGYPGSIYIFKTDLIDDVITYIKIRYNPPDEIVCISFHEDE